MAEGPPQSTVLTRTRNVLCRTKLIDMAQKLLDAVADLVPFRAQRLDVLGKLRIDALRICQCRLRRRKVFQRGVFFLAPIIVLIVIAPVTAALAWITARRTVMRALKTKI